MGADNTLGAGSATVSGAQLPQVDRASWRNLGGVLIASPGVASVNGTITYSAEGVDHRVYTRTPTLGYAPTPWFCTGHPAAGTFGTSSQFACQGLDTQLWYSMNSGSGWGDAQQLGGILVDGPGIAAGPAGATMYVESLDGSVWHRALSTGWTNDGGIVRNGVGASYIP
jgi:hypothetical protein